MKTYTFFNATTNHVFYESDNLQDTINFYHKVPRRKHCHLIIINNATGEVVRAKLPKEEMQYAV